jgi:ferredoxin
VCVALAPAMFDLADDGELVLFNDGRDVPGSELEAVEEAVSSCPVDALTLTSRPTD